MKKLILLFLFLCFSSYLFSQDIIITEKNERIEAKIITVYEAVVKYALFNDPDGPTKLILKSKIKSITYANGEVENLGNVEYNLANNKTNATASNEKIFKHVIKIKECKHWISTYYKKGFRIFSIYRTHVCSSC